MNNQNNVTCSRLPLTFSPNVLLPTVTAYLFALTLQGGRLGSDEFEFLQFHFHWGSSSSQGSEHTLDGVSYPAELHYVHWNRKYGDVASALAEPDGLAVLGFFLEVHSKDNGNYKDLVDALPSIMTETSPQTSFTIGSKVKLAQFMPTSGPGDNYYFYAVSNSFSVLLFTVLALLVSS